MGLRGIKNLLFSYGTQKILADEHGVDQRTLWDHSYRCAYYAYNLAKNFKPGNRALQDDAYVGGMLHDMGKIIFSSVHPELLDQIKTFCDAKGIDTETFEDLAGGMNHAEIGARIAEKWNFPDSLVAAIRFHHEPQLMTTDFKDVVFTVYLANVFCEYENGGMSLRPDRAPRAPGFRLSEREAVCQDRGAVRRGIQAGVDQAARTSHRQALAGSPAERLAGGAVGADELDQVLLYAAEVVALEQCRWLGYVAVVPALPDIAGDRLHAARV